MDWLDGGEAGKTAWYLGLHQGTEKPVKKLSQVLVGMERTYLSGKSRAWWRHLRHG